MALWRQMWQRIPETMRVLGILALIVDGVGVPSISPLFFVHSRSLLSLCSFSHRFSALWAGTEGQCGDVTPHCPSVRGSRRS